MKVVTTHQENADSNRLCGGILNELCDEDSDDYEDDTFSY